MIKNKRKIVLWILAVLWLGCNYGTSKKATAVWYIAGVGDTWWCQVPELGRRDGTMRPLWKYVQTEYCIVVPTRDTLEFPVGARVKVWGERGEIGSAVIVGITEDTVYGLIGDAFTAIVTKASRMTGWASVKITLLSRPNYKRTNQNAAEQVSLIKPKSQVDSVLQGQESRQQGGDDDGGLELFLLFGWASGLFGE